jgi:predicted membrane GTPase involved in stress response
MFLSMTSGSGMMNHVFDHYGPVKVGNIGQRKNGVLVSMTQGQDTGLRIVVTCRNAAVCSSSPAWKFTKA